MLAARLEGEGEKQIGPIGFLALAKAQKKVAAAPNLNRLDFSNSVQEVSSVDRTRTQRASIRTELKMKHLR